MSKLIGVLALARPEHSGVYTYTLSLLRSLKSSSEYKFEILTNYENLAFANTGHPISFLPRGVSNKFKKALGLGSAYMGWKWRGFFTIKERKYFEKYDAFISPRTDYFPHAFVNRPTLVTIHDFQDRYYPEYFSPSSRLHRRLHYRAAARAATRVLCESSYVKRDIVRFVGKSDDAVDVLVVPPIVNVDLQANSSPHARNGRGAYFFYPAQFWPHKNHLRLVRAFSKFQRSRCEVNLALSGLKSNDYEKVLKEVRNLGIEKQVIFLGYLPYKEVISTLKSALALVMPSLFESVSIPIYEAFKLGVPVCSSKAVGLDEQVGDAGLVFDPFEVGEIEDAMMRIYSDPELRMHLIEKGKIRIHDLTPTKVDSQMKEILRLLW